MGLMDELRKISARINQQRPMMTNEVATELVSIHPFIRALGYDIGNLNEVQPQYTADARASGSERVDYAIKQQGKPIIFIESKAANKVLSENYWRQLYDYFGAEDVRFGILTNGIEYRFYADLDKDNIMDSQPFLIIDMLNINELLVKELEGFTKAGFDPERILSSARKLAILPILDKEFRQPSKEFVRYFAKQVNPNWLEESDLEAFRPIFKQAWQEFVEQKIASRLPTVSESEAVIQDPLTTANPTIRPISGDKVEVPIFASFQGQRCEAILLLTNKIRNRDANIKFKGETLTPSAAGKKAKRSIDPESPGGTDGWRFWRFLHPDTDKEHIIEDLRDDEALRRRLLGTD